MKTRLTQLLQWSIRNLDSTLTIVLAATFAVLSLLSIGTIRTVLAGTLVVLVLLSVATLRDRLDREILRGTLTELDINVGKIRSIQEQANTSAIVADDEAADARQLHAMIEALPKIISADLLAFSGRDARGVLEQILEHSGCPTRLLLKHPDSVGRVQRTWIIAELERIQRYLIPQYGDLLSIKCYRAPYSLRGRKLNPYIINVGWYTPLVDDDVEVVGHTNPLVIATLDTAQGAALGKMFDRLFESLWTASTTEDGASVVASLSR